MRDALTEITRLKEALASVITKNEQLATELTKARGKDTAATEVSKAISKSLGVDTGRLPNHFAFPAAPLDFQKALKVKKDKAS